MAAPWEPRLALESWSPAVTSGGLLPVSPVAWCALCALLLVSGAESPLSWDMGCGQKGGRPLAHHALYICVESSAKPFIEGLSGSEFRT